MSYAGEPGGYYNVPPPTPEGRSSSWIWPTVLGAGMVLAAVLVLLIALQLTDDDGAATPDATTSTSASPTTTTLPATAAPTTVASPASSAAPTPAASALPASTPAPQPAAGSDQGDGDDGPVDRSCSSYTPDETLPVRLCASGSLVEEIQLALATAGHTVDVDGFFGPGTEIAVLEFQSNNGLEQDGIVGPATFAALPSVLIEGD